MGLKWYSLAYNSLKCLAWSWTFYCSNSDEKNPVKMCNPSIWIDAISIFKLLPMPFIAFLPVPPSRYFICALVICLSLLQPVSTSFFFLPSPFFSCRLLLFHPREFPWEGYVIAPPTSKGSRGRKAADWGNLVLGHERPLILIPNRHTSKWSRGWGWGCKTWQVGTDLSLFILRR